MGAIIYPLLYFNFNSHATLFFNTELQLIGSRSCFRHKLASKTPVISLNADKMINFMSEQNWQASFKLQNIENTQIFKAGENIDEYFILYSPFS